MKLIQLDWIGLTQSARIGQNRIQISSRFIFKLNRVSTKHQTEGHPIETAGIGRRGMA